MLDKKKSPSEDRKSPMSKEEIIEESKNLTPQWEVVDNHHITRQFAFKNYQEALSFTNEIGRMAEEEKHHPDILLSYGAVTITLCTHSVNGLSKKDFSFASKIDADFSSYK